MKLRHFASMLVLCASAISLQARVESQLVASHGDSDSIWIVWSVSRTDDGLIFVRGASASASRDLTGQFHDPIACVRLESVDGTLVGLTAATERIPAPPVRWIPLYGPEGLHEIPKAMHHGPVPIFVACAIHRKPLLDWVRAHPAVVRIHAEFRSPTFEVGARVVETSSPVVLSAELIVSAERSSLTVDIPEVSIKLSPFDISAEKKPNPDGSVSP